MQEIRIAQTWDGVAVDSDEQVVLELYASEAALVFHVDAPWHGDPPPPGPVGSTPKLWEHEVVELFIAGKAHEYTEIEVGPHGHFLVLRFCGERQQISAGHTIEWVRQRHGARWRGVARVSRDLLPTPPHAVGAFAIHGEGPARRYLAAYPCPGDAPNFHQLAAFRSIDVGGGFLGFGG